MPRTKKENPLPELLNEAIAPLMEQLAKTPALERIDVAFRMSALLQGFLAEAGAARRSGVRELRAEGWTQSKIAKAIGITVARVQQIQDGNPKASRRIYVPVAEQGQPREHSPESGITRRRELPDPFAHSIE